MGSFISGESAWRRSRRVITNPAPAAGQEWTITVPAGKVWRIVSLSTSLVTAVAVANRSPRLVLTDGDATYLTIPPVAVQAASLTGSLSWVEHGASYATAPDQVMALPDLVIGAGWTLASSTTNIQAADQYGTQTLLVIETTVQRGPLDMLDVAELNVAVITAPQS